MKKSYFFTASLILSVYLCLPPSQGYCQTATTSNGLQWLTSVQQPDGYWGDLSSPIMRNTASAAEAFQMLDQASSSYAVALQWLATRGSFNNDYVSRRLNLFAKTTNDISADLSYLLSARKPDGGWGLEADAESGVVNTALALQALKAANYTDSNILYPAVTYLNDYVSRRLNLFAKTTNDISADLSYLLSARKPDGGWGLEADAESGVVNTALALQALKAANYTDSNILYPAVTYLTTNQNTDGGFGFTSGGPSNAYVTAYVLRALSAYNSTFDVKASITKASAYLLTKQNSDGGFGSSPSNAYETALSIISLTESGQGNSTVLQNAINYITTTQLADGSWNDDPYYTALALQALANVKPNLSLTTTDITFSKLMPQTGESITITASIKNTGLEPASNIIVRFYQDDPAAGGTQIGADQILQLVARGSSAQVFITQSFIGTGTRNIFVVVDPDNLISETSKADNRAMARLWVATGADLAVFSEDLKPSTYTPASGTAFTLDYTVRNLGETTTGAFDVAVYDGQPSGTPIQTANVSGIGGTETRTGTFGITLTGDGSHTLYVVADSGNAIIELSKANNIA